MRNRVLLSSFMMLFLLHSVAYSQSASVNTKHLNNMLPHSPEATAMANYTALPVSLYTGLPEISIPIFEIKGKSLKLPISLSYHYNGFKPAEVASSAGLGWNVQGGGVITRMIKGRVDHEDFHVTGNDYDDYASMDVMLYNKQEKLKLMADGMADGEPDIFVFNCNGLSGKFILIKGKAYTLPYQDIRIDGNVYIGFTITSASGDTYYFGEPETTHHHQLVNTPYVPDHASAWYLTKIVSADKADTINYAYNSYDYHQLPVYGNTYTINTSDGNVNGGDQQSWSESYSSDDRITDAKQLSSISYKNTYINFFQGNEPRRDLFFRDSSLYPLESISVSTDAGTYRVFQLKHAYFNAKLNLTGVDVFGNGEDSSNMQRYRFEYEHEDTASNVTWWLNKSIDKWGYYNGADNSARMLFTTDDVPSNSPFVNICGDRQPNTTYAMTNILKKITYPTGGYTEFEYEHNKVGQNEDGPGLRMKRMKLYAHNGLSTPSLQKEYSYDNAMSWYKTGNIVNTVRIHGSLCAPAMSCENTPMPMDKDRITMQAAIYSPLSDLLNTPFYYRSVTEINRSDTGTGRTRYEFNSFGADDPDVYLWRQTDEAYTGGHFVTLRQVTNDYNVTDVFRFLTITAEQTDEMYTPNGCFLCAELSSPDQTQAVLGLQKIYTSSPGELYSSSYKLLNRTSTVNWEPGSTTPVSNVTDYYYDNRSHRYPTRMVTHNSKGEQLTTRLRYPLDYLPAATSPRYILDSTFAQQRIDAANLYTRRYDSLVTALLPYQPYATNTTPNQTRFSQIVDSFDCEDAYKTASAVMYANRDTAWAQYHAALDAAQSSATLPWLQSVYWMQRNNFFAPVIEKYTTIQKADGNEYLLTATRNEYALQNNAAGIAVPVLAHVSETELAQPLVFTSFISDTGNYYKQQVTMEYDTQLNLVSQWKKNDVKQSFLWGYQGQYPVAIVTGADYTTIAGLVDQQVLNNGVGNEAALRSELNNLRQALAGSKAQVTGYTYHIPTGDITSQSDVNGRVTYYLYDTMGRLQAVKDNEGNIIKTFQYHYQQ